MLAVSSILSALAAVTIAYFTFRSHKMYTKIQEKDGEYKKQTRDLYQAIVISNLFCAGDSTHTKIESFNNLYKGETKIF